MYDSLRRLQIVSHKQSPVSAGWLMLLEMMFGCSIVSEFERRLEIEFHHLPAISTCSQHKPQTQGYRFDYLLIFVCRYLSFVSVVIYT